MARNALGFGDDSSDSEPETQPPQRRGDALARSLLKQKSKPVNMDDSTYSYDDHYDSIQESRKAKLRRLGAGENKGPKYINSLLEAKKRREQDKLVVQDLKIQRERDLEGDDYKGKEEFITGAYREHKEKLKNLEREPVEKLGDMKDFHRAVVNDGLNGDEPQTTFVDIATIGTSDTTKSTIGHSDSPSSKQTQTDSIHHTTKQFEKIEQKGSTSQQPTSRLIPKLSQQQINEYRERYFQRKATRA